MKAITSKPWRGRQWCSLGTSITSLDGYTGRLETLSGLVNTNVASSGATLSSSGSNATAGFTSQLAAIPLNAELVTIEAGINDFRLASTLGSMGDTTVSTFYGALRVTLRAAKTADLRRTVAFIMPYPNTSVDATTYSMPDYSTANSKSKYLYEYQEAIEKVCNAENVPIIRPQNIGGQSDIDLSDGVHLNAAGEWRLAGIINDWLNRNSPRRTAWTLSTAVIGDFTGTRLTPSSIDGSGIVQWTGAPSSGVTNNDWAALWLATGSNNAMEFEVAETGKGLWITLGRASGAVATASAWIGKGDPGFDAGQFQYKGTFTSSSVLIPSGDTSANDVGAYATKYRVGRIGNFVLCEAYESSTWKTAFAYDLVQHGFTAAHFAVDDLGILVNQSAYTKPKNVRVGTMEIR